MLGIGFYVVRFRILGRKRRILGQHVTNRRNYPIGYGFALRRFLMNLRRGIRPDSFPDIRPDFLRSRFTGSHDRIVLCFAFSCFGLCQGLGVRGFYVVAFLGAVVAFLGAVVAIAPDAAIAISRKSSKR